MCVRERESVCVCILVPTIYVSRGFSRSGYVLHSRHCHMSYVICHMQYVSGLHLVSCVLVCLVLLLLDPVTLLLLLLHSVPLPSQYAFET